MVARFSSVHLTYQSEAVYHLYSTDLAKWGNASAIAFSKGIYVAQAKNNLYSFYVSKILNVFILPNIYVNSPLD